MIYVKYILSGLAAMFHCAVCVFLAESYGNKGHWIGYGRSHVGGEFPLPLFWILAGLLFWLFFVASRGGTILRVLFFCIPTLVVSALGFAFLGLLTYGLAISRHQ